jgi:radical SAM superfamily enzyme YgiQ (UPF0313 family)
MDILLINPGKIRHDYYTEHLGLASLKTYVQSRGYTAETLDMAIECLSVLDGINTVISLNPKSVGISLLDDSKTKGLALIEGIREAGYQGYIIIGGYFATFAASELLRDYAEIDFVVRGEGEITLAELLDMLVGHRNISLRNILGISFRERGQICQNNDRPLIEDLDILPAVDRKYSKRVLEKEVALRLNGTRGCWGQCSFCDIIGMYGSSPGKAWRYRSVKNILDEIENLIKIFNTHYFVFNDDQFLLRGKRGEERAEAFAAEIEHRGLEIEFELMCRADTVQRRTMKRLQDVGLKRVFLGLESFDQKQLQRFKKRITVRQNLKALITLYQLKIDVVASVILADAFTTLWDMVKQFIFLFELRRRYFNSPQCQISVNQKIEVYRGSAIYSEYKELGLLTTDHYLTGYQYKLRFWTAFRLKLFDLEAKIGRLIFHPGDVVKHWVSVFSWSISQLKNNYIFQR